MNIGKNAWLKLNVACLLMLLRQINFCHQPSKEAGQEKHSNKVRVKTVFFNSMIMFVSFSGEQNSNAFENRPVISAFTIPRGMRRS